MERVASTYERKTLRYKLMAMITIQIGVDLYKVGYSLWCGYFAFRTSQGQFDNLHFVVSVGPQFC